MKKPESPKPAYTKFRRSFLIGICEGPAIVFRIWKDKKLIYDVDDVDLDDLGDITIFMGDGVTSPYDLITSENPADVFSDYKNLCCAFFEQYELGQGGLIPNFVFEIERQPDISQVLQVLQTDEVPEGFIAIKTIEDLQNIEELSKNKYVLVNHIDASETKNWNEGAGFDPIKFFRGTFDGQGWSIKNLFINRPDSTGGGIGLFEKIDNEHYLDRFIKNIVLINPVITGYGSVGGLAGIIYADHFSDIYIIGGYITNTSWRGRTGGIAGNVNLGDISSSFIAKRLFSSATIFASGHSSYSGGLFGEGGGYLKECFSTGNVRGEVVGGLVGQGDGILEDSSAEGDISPDSGSFRGGLIGVEYATIRRCCSSGYVPGSGVTIGGLVGKKMIGAVDEDNFWDVENSTQPTSVMGTGKTTAQMKQETTFTNWDFDAIWVMNEKVSYPKLRDIKLLSWFERCFELTGFQIMDLLINTRYGAIISESYLDASTFEDIDIYCFEKGYFFSFVLNERKPVLDWIDYINSHFKGFLVMEGDKIKLKAFRNEESQFPITRDNLFVEEGENPQPPVQVKVRDYKDTANRIEISFTDRDRNYDVAIAVAVDAVDQQISGKVRTKTIQFDGIMDVDLAQEMAYRQLFECLYRFHFYSFTLSYKSMAVSPGSVGTLNDGFQIVDQRIRILSIDETKDGKHLAIEAVEDKPYLYAAVEYEGAISRHVQDTPPTLVDALVEFAEDPLEAILYLMVIPQSDASVQAPGWLIYQSWEEAGDYVFQGSHIVANVKGNLTSALPAHPSVIYRVDETFTVDVGDYGVLTSASDSAFFSNLSLCKVGSEIIAYKTAERIGETNVFRLTGLIRGINNTEPAAHSIDETFLTLDTPYQFNYSMANVGRTAYFKVLTFLGDDVQQIEDVSAVSHLITSEHHRPACASLVRINGREGFQDYAGATFTLDWTLCSKIAGFNLGSFNWDGITYWKWTPAREASGEDPPWNDGTLFGAYQPNLDLEQIVLRFEEIDGTLIGEKELDPDDESELITKATDLGGYDPARIKVIPRTSLRAIREVSIEVDQL